MSLRQVLTVFNTERQLNGDETALLNALRSWSDAERQMFIDSLSDKPQKKPGSERVYERCAQCGTTKGHRYHKDSSDDGYHEFQTPAKSTKKSARASSLQQQISGRAQSAIRPPTEATDDDGSNSGNVRCQFTRADSKPCHLLPDHNIHHLPTANEFHDFVAGKSDAQSAAGGL